MERGGEGEGCVLVSTSVRKDSVRFREFNYFNLDFFKGICKNYVNKKYILIYNLKKRDV